jgi:flavodoxin long chain
VIQEDWEAIWDQLDTVNLDGKIIAMYGMGDQLGYGEWFLDALGMLHDKLAPKGVTFIGYWPTEGYEFTSKTDYCRRAAVCGLALDETNQYDLSDERLQNWCEQILVKWPKSLAALIPASVVATSSGADLATPRIHTVCRQPQMLATPVHLA